MADQISINVTDNIPPINQATIDAEGRTGNTYSKEQLEVWKSNLDSGINLGFLTPSSPAAPATGIHRGQAAEAGTYANYGGIIVTTSELTDNHVLIEVREGVATKVLSTKINGDSAYEVAVNNGFSGTEAEWLKTMYGNDKAKGQIVDGVVWETGKYLNIAGIVSPDPSFSLSEHIPVIEGSVLRVVGNVPAGLTIGGYKNTFNVADILVNGYTDTTFAIPPGVKTIRVTSRNSLPTVISYAEFTLNTVTPRSLREFTENKEIDRAEVMHQKGAELITEEIIAASVSGFLLEDGSIVADATFKVTPHIPVYPGEYKVNSSISGGASIVGFDASGKRSTVFKVGSIGDGIINVPYGATVSLRISFSNTLELSLVPQESILNYVDIDNKINGANPLYYFDNLKNADKNFKQIGGSTSGPRYAQIGAAYKIPITVNRPTAISFKFRILEDVNTTSALSELFKISFENGDNVKAEIIKGVNQRYDLVGGEDQWVTYDYTACIPKYNSGFKVSKTVSGITDVESTETRNLTRKNPLVGFDAFLIRQIDETAANVGTSLRITGAALEIFKGATVIKSYEIKPTEPVKELTDRIKADIASNALAGFEIETFELENRKQSELLKITEVPLTTNDYGISSWGCYVPYKVDTSWHTFELYFDDMLHYNPAYAFTIPAGVVSIDGVQTVIHPNASLIGAAEILINGGNAQLEITDLEIQDRVVKGYERQNDPTVATIASKYSKQIVGLMGHYVLKVDAGDPLIVNSGYGFDGSTDRIQAVKSLADKNGYTCITVKDLADYYQGLKDIPNKCYFWLFDDIEINIFTDKKIRDIFVRLGITPSFAIVNSGTYSDGTARPNRGSVDVEDFYAQYPKVFEHMKMYGWVPVMHGYTHTQVDGMSRADFVNFLSLGQEKSLEQGVYNDIYTYAYGPHSVRTAKYMQHNGIRMAITTTNFISSDATGRFAISRVNASDIDQYPFAGIFRNWFDS